MICHSFQLAEPPRTCSDRCVDLRWLGEPLAENTELGHLFRVQLVVALSEVSDCAIEPFVLIFGKSSDDSALHDVLKHLVARFFERGRDGRDASRISGLLLVH